MTDSSRKTKHGAGEKNETAVAQKDLQKFGLTGTERAR